MILYKFYCKNHEIGEFLFSTVNSSIYYDEMLKVFVITSIYVSVLYLCNKYINFMLLSFVKNDTS